MWQRQHLATIDVSPMHAQDLCLLLNRMQSSSALAEAACQARHLFLRTHPHAHLS